MKKLLLALTLLAPMINAESTEVSQDQLSPETIQFVAKFKRLHSFCIETYTAIEQLFKDCAGLYTETFDLLADLQEHEDETLKQQCRELHDTLAPAILDLNELLHRVNQLNLQMKDFNAMIEQDVDYQEVTKSLLAIAQEAYTIRMSLEAIKQYEAEIKAKALELSEGI